jgi:exonuclease SbcC
VLTERNSIAVHEIQRLEGQLGLSTEALDPNVEAAAHTAAARDLAVRDRASDLVARSGRSVVQRVLPSTIEHMRRLLPTLTDGRYFDAELTDDYRIQVLDERAGAWKQKNIFSGGTKDQFSLALRLAFALATLPEERGAAPSFLFLDEPLGAFDDSRARALVELLTTGEIASSFDQVFLISHVRVDESLFDYQLTLAGGRVAESNLPGGAAPPRV